MADPVGVPTVVLWRSPANRLHLRQQCSGNGRPKDTKKTKVTVEQFDAARAEQKVCRCVMSDPFGRPPKAWLR